jgi:UPF0716 protein FxsA
MPLLFIAIPFIELYFIIVVGGMIGAFWTVILVIMTAVIGINLVRVQGMSTLMRAQQNMSKGQTPAMEMMEGVALAAAGVLLIIPGFITDFIGLLCLVPASRRVIIRYLMARSAVKTSFYGRVDSRSPHQSSHQSSQWQSDSQQHDSRSPDAKQAKVGRTIEGEYTRED